MAGQGRVLLALGAVLVVGVGAAVWSLSGGGSNEAKSPAVGDAAPSEATSKTASAAAKRPKLHGTASVVGEVRRSKGKVPVPDQDVQLVPEKGEPWVVKTDAHGAFKLAEIPHGGPYELRVAAPGCGTIRIPGMALDRDEKRDVGTLWLDPAVKATVVVRTWGDAPVEGALVEAFAVPTPENFDWSKALAQMNQAPVAVAKATTDAKGEALFPETTVGRWTFVASKTGFSRVGRATTFRADAPPAPLEIRLGAAFPLSGRVFDSAKNPVVGAQVLAGPPGSNWDPSSSALRSRTATDAQGRYEFAALDAGDASLSVGRPGGNPTPVATVKIPNIKTFDVYLKGSATLTGTVSDKDGGKPVEGATVRAFSYASGGVGASTSEAVTDAAGKYSASVTAGTVGFVSAEKDGWASADDPSKRQQTTAIREGETQTRDLALRAGSKATGVVKGPDGPIAGARVSVSSGGGDRAFTTKSATTDADGKYEVTSLAPGKAVVRVEAAGFFVKDYPDNPWMVLQSPGPSPFKFDVPAGGAATKDVEMVRGVAIDGRVDGPDGPLAGVRVTPPGDPENGVVTGADGAFRVEGVKPGQSVLLSLSKEGYAPAASNKPISVSTDAPTTGVVMRMTALVVVTGTVTASDGGPIREGRVTASSWSDGNGSDARFTRQFFSSMFDASGAASAAAVRADGTYELKLTGQTGNKVSVTVTALDRPATTSDPVSLSDGQTSCVVNVTIGEGKDLSGQVVASPGGASVPGAAITIQSRGASGSMPRQFAGSVNGRSFSSDGGASSIVAVTDSDGRFTIPHLATGGYTVSARADGFVAGSAQVDLAATNQVTINVEQELTIEGVVTLRDGTPVEGANVGASRDAPVPSTPPGSPSFFRPPGGGGASTTTGTGGTFRIEGLSAGAYRLFVTSGRQGGANIRTKRTDPVAAGSTGVSVVVDAGGIIAGKILDPQRQGVGGISVYAGPDPVDGKSVDGAESRSARTADDGTFQIVGLADVTTFTLTAQANSNWGSTYKNATLKGVAVGTTNVEIVLDEGLSITGVLVDGDGKPVAGAYLFCSSSTSDGRPRQSRNAMTDGSGAFTVAGLDAGDCSFMLAGGVDGLSLMNGDKVAAGTRDVRLVAAKGLSIAGVVVDESGAPATNVFVRANSKNGARGGSAVSGEGGAFEIKGLAAGAAYDVVATGGGHGPGATPDVAAGAANVRVAMTKGLEASGRVVDDKGAAVKGGVLFVRLATDGTQSQSAPIDESGNFSLKGLGEGTYDAQAMSTSAMPRTLRKCGTLKAGDTGVELHMEP